MMTLVTPLRCRQPGERDARDRRAVRLGDRRHRVDDVEGALLVDRREVERGAARVVAGPLPSRANLPRQEAAGERAPHHDAEPLVLDQRHDLALEVAAGDRVVGLHRLEAGAARAARRSPSAFMICQAARLEQPIVAH